MTAEHTGVSDCINDDKHFTYIDQTEVGYTLLTKIPSGKIYTG